MIKKNHYNPRDQNLTLGTFKNGSGGAAAAPVPVPGVQPGGAAGPAALLQPPAGGPARCGAGADGQCRAAGPPASAGRLSAPASLSS